MRPRLRLAGLVILLALLPSVPALNSRGFFSPDETNHAEVAREMLESGDLVVPTFDGRPFLLKPPLIYWLLAASFALFGWGLPAAVLLNTVLTAATALVIYSHVRRTSSSRAGPLAAVAYLTMLLPSAVARTALIDPALVLCTTSAVVVFLADRHYAAVVAGFALGLGILAKGPIAPLVVLPALATVVVVRRDRRILLRVATAVATALVVALPWHLALAARGLWGEYVRVFVGHELLSRAVDSWPQRGPWWYYAPVIWAAAFPWGVHLAVAVRGWWGELRRDASLRATRLAEAAGVVAPLLTFSLAANKFPHYVLPVLPWLARWLGRSADRLLHPAQPDEGLARVAPLGGALTGGALIITAVMLIGSRFADMLPTGVAVSLAVAGFAWIVMGLVERRHPAVVWSIAAALALCLHAVLDVVVAPTLDGRLLERPLAASVRRHLAPDALPVAHGWFRPSMVAYGARGWRLSESEAELATILDDAGRAHRPVLIVTRADMEGPARAVCWRRGGQARELTRVSGLGEINGEVLEGVVFAVDPARDGRRWFFDAGAEADGISGFDGAEGNSWTPSFRWSVARTARLTIPADPAGNGRLSLRLWGPKHNGHPQVLSIVLDDALLSRLTLAPTPRRFTVHVPAAVVRRGTQTLSLHAAHLVVPALTDPASNDRRRLAFAIDWLALDPVAEEIRLTR